jgi:hypothetical protein
VCIEIGARFWSVAVRSLGRNRLSCGLGGCLDLWFSRLIGSCAGQLDRSGRSLADPVYAVDREIKMLVDPAGRPAYLEPIDAVRRANAEPDAGVAGGEKTSAARALSDLPNST